MRLKGPENCGGFSFDGEAYAPDAEGCIDIADDNRLAIVAAMSHGFVQAEEIAAQAIEAPRRGRRRRDGGDA